MKQRQMAPLSRDAELLIAAERVIVPESEEVRARTFLRAQTALPRRSAALHHRSPPQKWWLRRGFLSVAAAASVFAAVAAVAALKGNWEPGARSPALHMRTLLPRGPVAHVTPGPPENVASDVSPAPAVPEPQSASAPEPRSVLKSKPSPASATERYQLELRLLQRARQAVWRGDFSTALAAIAEHERLFPNGQLIEEREALRVKALSGSGQTSAADAAALRFRQRFPRSVLLHKIGDTLSAP